MKLKDGLKGHFFWDTLYIMMTFFFSYKWTNITSAQIAIATEHKQIFLNISNENSIIS